MEKKKDRFFLQDISYHQYSERWIIKIYRDKFAVDSSSRRK